ncbi:MAG: Nif3-like dinuclear metal center hexameric protein [Oscillospiraceae bacterium]|nr:Nif3-like dinuclear metal center hexameric protein [Oscillospiraceae bacterium]
MIKVSDIFNTLEVAAPCRLAEEYDNPGFLVGRKNAEVTKVLVALDITEKIVAEAVETGAELIVAHHTVIFRSRKCVTDEDVCGSVLLALIENKISAICMHTNLDSAEGGVNDVLAEKLGVKNTRVLAPGKEENTGIGRWGELPEKMPLSDFLAVVCRVLDTSGVRYHDAGKTVKKVAVGGGSCGDFIPLAVTLGCDTIVTADIKHNEFLDAAALGINAIDAGHFATENIICPRICEIISEKHPGLDIRIADADRSCTKFFTV